MAENVAPKRNWSNPYPKYARAKSRNTRADLAAPHAAQKAAKEVAQEIVSAVQSFGYVVSDIQEAKLFRGFVAIISKHFPADAVRQAQRETWNAAVEVVREAHRLTTGSLSDWQIVSALESARDVALRADEKGEGNG